MVEGGGGEGGWAEYNKNCTSIVRDREGDTDRDRERDRDGDADKHEDGYRYRDTDSYTRKRCVGTTMRLTSILASLSKQFPARAVLSKQLLLFWLFARQNPSLPVKAVPSKRKLIPKP